MRRIYAMSMYSCLSVCLALCAVGVLAVPNQTLQASEGFLSCYDAKDKCRERTCLPFDGYCFFNAASGCVCRDPDKPG